jgi:hypothetical protein
VAVVILVGIVLTSTASAMILGTINIRNHNNNLCNIGQLHGSGLAGANCYTGVYWWASVGGGVA